MSLRKGRRDFERVHVARSRLIEAALIAQGIPEIQIANGVRRPQRDGIVKASGGLVKPALRVQDYPQIVVHFWLVWHQGQRAARILNREFELPRLIQRNAKKVP